MSNFIDEYLVRLGTSVDAAGFNKFHQALRDAATSVDRTTTGIVASFLKMGAGTATAFAAAGVAVVGFADKVAQADQEYRLFALHMYTSKTTAQGLKITLDALGHSLEDITWDPELRGRAIQLMADQRQMMQSTGGDYEAQLKKIRDIRFEFTRMEVELKYLGMNAVYSFMQALGVGPDKLLKTLQGWNQWIITHMPQIAQWLTTNFLPIWKDMATAGKEVWRAFEEVGTALTNFIGALSGDKEIQGTTFSLEKLAHAIQIVAHWMSVVIETGADFVDLLARIVSAASLAAGGDTSGAMNELKTAKQDINPRTIGAALGMAAAAASPLTGGGSLMALAASGVVTGLAGSAGAVAGDALKGQSDASERSSYVPFDSVKGYYPSPQMVAAVAAQESGRLGMQARSSAGAIGTMQLMPDTAKWLGVNPYDQQQNIEGGTKYLGYLLNRYKGNEALALGAYNAGQGRIDKVLSGLATLPAETRDYISHTLYREGRRGDVQVGSVVIHITPPPGTNPQQIADAVQQKLSTVGDKQTQRNMAEFNGYSYSW